MNPKELLDELKTDYLEGGHQHCREGWIQLKHCSFCSSDNYHLGLHLSSGVWACWRCGGGKSSWKVWRALGATADQIKGIVKGRPSERVKAQGTLTLPPSIEPMLPAHCRYLQSRGFDPAEIADFWGVQGIGLASRLAWRLFIPIIHQDEVVSWTTRAIGDVPQRYISASAAQERISHKTLVYGQDFCNHSIIVVEGPLDAWRVGPGAGALFGIAFTPAQVKRLVRHPYRYVVFDSTKEAQERAHELASQLSLFPGETHVIELDAEDPGSATPEEIRRLRRAAHL